MTLSIDRHRRWRSAIRAEPIVVPLLLGLIIATVLAVLWPTTESMLETWRRSASYSHCYFALPVALWITSRQSAALAGMAVQPFWPGLILIAAVGFVWMIGDLAGAAIVTQFSAIGLVIATALTALGVNWARTLAFPLALLFFAVPFGDDLLPLLIDRTADVTVAALRLTGIPVYREGNDFITPGGSWSVVEACAGVRYLIAALMTGCIFAWFSYRSVAKRIVFVALAVAVALVANWMRAYAIVLMAHFSGDRIGSSLNHNSWGWLIFGVAMFGLFALGARRADKPHGRRSPVSAKRERIEMQSIVSPLIACLITIAAWPAAAAWLESQSDDRPVRIEAVTAKRGWQATSNTAGAWTPGLVAPSATAVQTFIRASAPVGVYLAVYRGQKHAAELGSSMNRVVANESDRWRIMQNATATIESNGRLTPVRTAVVSGPSGQWLIWHWYWLGGHTMSSDARVKIQLALQKLTGNSDLGAWVAIYTPVSDDPGADSRRLKAFFADMSSAIDTALQATAVQ